MSDNHHTPASEETGDTGFFEKPGMRKILWVALLASCAIFAALGIYGMVAGWMHPYFTLDGLPVFYALAGAIVAAVLGAGGRLLSEALTKPSDYYDSPADETRPDDGEGRP
ncbi:hypothetical protein [Aquisalinus flavus]|uniref:Uncharacterized protein n=1 Tax=Aquisalinus flavus TaxID=1526572 RepID=A0A8J2V7J7_9PROT|nr:hypothetical protein [Aquisalinus flavus]MBD0426268.1 hypothetical protein [Aquisalinus flavus]UNE48161.1 hypothetical protein FF099_08915 [Aquisalinus flavus]GGD09299.1 hypothetical protein GCM10011342_17690 [Aquisalinus flavus]